MALDATALVALIISVIALAIALAQLLAQVVGTVEGHRKCQASVMGKWSKHTHRHWRWTQFRVETRFSTPEIILASYCPPKTSHTIAITGDKESRTETLVPEKDGNILNPNDELVCWVPLLIALHKHSAPIFEHLSTAYQTNRASLSQLRWPAIRRRKRSWDFMPPDIARPFATTSASDIAVLACRMGVVWKEFRPPEGIMQGQGGEHMFAAVNVRGLGTLLGYTRSFYGNSQISRGDRVQSTYKKWKLKWKKMRKSSGTDQENGKEEKEDKDVASVPLPINLWVCTPDADRMWFGILPGNRDLSLPTFNVGTNDDVIATLQKLDPEGVAVRHLGQMQARHHGYLHGFCDIVPMFAPWLRKPASQVNCYPKPLGSDHTLGLTWYCVAYRVFYDQLVGYNNSKGTTQTHKIARLYKNLNRKYKDEWDGISAGLRDRPIEYYDELETLYKDTSDYFQGNLPEEDYAHGHKWNPRHYIDLVTAHLREAPRSYPDALWAIENGRGHGIPTGGDRYWRGEAMMYYWFYMPDYVRVMTWGTNINADLVEEAWITLVFRAFLWMRAHIPCENPHPLPSQYYGSRLPVFIG
ncbi:uncharacterized protein EI97DRAFT_430028 [Westerdykella ornata]|uniref:Uncharacterized protein n=1 Tax=Westerdykella ornata TaxID=318751 RepID=A0A6A6JX27_WESOR|nr:uncharacterized protein EI97DRAFT_430028 [Westerdykella ornata]KAF2280286.1 hypothetical protein EI97DRAFT_430028 [Westerdykella ornata]